MAILPMQRIRMYVLKQHATDALRILQREGCVEFVNVTEEVQLRQREKEEFEFNYLGSRLDFAVRFLSPYAPKTGALRGMIEGDRVRIPEHQLTETVPHYSELIDELQTIERNINESRAKRQSLRSEEKILIPWRDLRIPLSLPLETRTTLTYTLSGKQELFARLIALLEEERVLFAVHHVGDTKKLLTVFKDDRERVENEIRALQIETVTLPKRRGTPAEELERIARALAKEDERLSLYEATLRERARTHLHELKIAADQIYWKRLKHDLIATAQGTERVFVFEGWAPQKRITKLKRAVSDVTPYFDLICIDMPQNEEPPVEINNHPIIKPFESVTRLYGLPSYRDIDPTMFLSAFFFLFFGLSLTDVGYGIILAAITAYILWRYRVPKESKPMLTLIMFGGIASILVGLLFGGYFGIDTQLLPAWLRSLQRFDPISNPIPVFYLALACGAVQIMFGLLLNIVRAAKNGAFADGLMDSGPWLALFITLGIWGANLAGILSGDPKYSLWLVYASLALIVVTQGRHEKSLFAKLFKGVLSLYDSVSYFSDILSYSRLLALGLATSALAFAVNLIAEMVRDVPYVGIIIMAAILVVGHLFNLVVNVLGAFIHSARLQFVEFFGKFITGSGRSFRPLKRVERHIIIE